jgi:hypothetical protein
MTTLHFSWPRFLLYGLLLCLSVLTGCVKSTGVEVTPTPTATSVAATQIQPTVTNTPKATSTPISLATLLTPMATATASPTYTVVPPTETPTITPAPTLSVEQEDILLSELMASNGGCELPCWWGITPGMTDVQTARDMFASHGITWREGDVILGYVRPDSPLYYPDVRLIFLVKRNIVHSIVVYGSRDPYEISFRFTEDWRQYSLSNMLDRNGSPLHILLEAPIFTEVNVPNEYLLSLYFVPLDGIVTYRVAAEYIGNGKNRLCSNFADVQEIYMELYAPGELRGSHESRVQEALDHGFITWETATGMSIKEFYDFFKDANSPKCVEVD